MLNDLDTTASVFPVSLEGGAGRVVLARMDRPAYVRSVFLDQRMSPADRNLGRASMEELETRAGEAGVEARPVRLILHTGFCGSTLLARVLDVPGRCLSYKEPLILHQISLLQRAPEAGSDDVTRASRVCAQLLSRGFDDGEVALIKPSDTASTAAPVFLDDGVSRALVLYDGLKEFVVTMLRRQGRLPYIRDVAHRAPHDLRTVPAIAEINPQGLTDPQAAALAWLGLAHVFAGLRERYGQRVMFLESTRFRDDPVEGSVTAAGVLGAGPEEIEHINARGSDIMARHSKGEVGFNRNAARAQRDRDRERLRDSVEQAVMFVDQHGEGVRDRFESAAGEGIA